MKMLKVTCFLLVISVAYAKPGIFDEHSFDTSLLASAHAPLLPAPVLPAIFKAPVFAPAPVYAPAPIYKAIAPAPIYKAIAPAPIIKAIAPATSYATVTQFHVAHPVVKTVLAPQPILKTIAVPAPLSFGHGYH